MPKKSKHKIPYRKQATMPKRLPSTNVEGMLCQSNILSESEPEDSMQMSDEDFAAEEMRIVNEQK